MKKIILVILLAVSPILSYGQDIFDKYEDNDKVTFVAMQPKMFQMLGKMSVSSDDPEAKEFFDLVNSITSFKVITTEDAAISKDVSSWVTTRLKSSSFEELMRVRDGDSNVKFYVKEGKDDDHVKELLMFVTGMKDQNIEVNGRKLETVLLSLTGDINLRNISKLTQKMDLPGGEQLGKAGEKNKG
ncbi:DUF4252 domain-containing protein [Flavobacteriaceae bacterium TP-CH-4]|uniref:DUF4252 domain-containing protein n=1 Tax=Pelagihabitans pacificus TaxID=2696054 RepID=A0A967E6P1_9FLAO|nr:DUF4252 domain-containing protein [Pelagihabitans pacificus]NHF59374.1 DUF4252 domain-containing protein [Pelagihabitans pacificus]